jgi:hypothetical protein
MAVETNRIDLECALCPSVSEAEIGDRSESHCAIHQRSFEPVRAFFQKDMFSES